MAKRLRQLASLTQPNLRETAMICAAVGPGPASIFKECNRLRISSLFHKYRRQGVINQRFLTRILLQRQPFSQAGVSFVKSAEVMEHGSSKETVGSCLRETLLQVFSLL